MLEKDNDLDIASLARANAEDILKVHAHSTYTRTHCTHARTAHTCIHTVHTLKTHIHTHKTQPIYVLEKDNDLDIASLARANAEDILKVQPEGPFLLGGHSYGGTVAVEVALVLESWGHEVGLVMVSRVFTKQVLTRFDRALTGL